VNTIWNRSASTENKPQAVSSAHAAAAESASGGPVRKGRQGMIKAGIPAKRAYLTAQKTTLSF